MTEAIDAEGLIKRFGKVTALDGLDLEVRTGEVHGFLGPNGAGKTTTIRILLGLLQADSGTATLLGGDPWNDVTTLHRRLAYVPGDVTLWPSLSGGEVIDLLGRLRGGLDQRRRAELLERFELDPRKKTRTYSKGNRQKVALIAALASDVELLLLDEPTSALDEEARDGVERTLLDLVRRTGVSMVLVTHDQEQARRLGDRIVQLGDGRVVA
jgi:ABC-2 type transport system ATP-binding protein